MHRRIDDDSDDGDGEGEGEGPSVAAGTDRFAFVGERLVLTAIPGVGFDDGDDVTFARARASGADVVLAPGAVHLARTLRPWRPVVEVLGAGGHPGTHR
jgi:hypothetical protein